MSIATATLIALSTVSYSVDYQDDELGRLVAENGNSGQNVRYAYAAEDRLIQITD